MTAFEILLNRFYDTIENSKPESSLQDTEKSTSRLSMLIRNYIDTSFEHGSYLSYQPTLTSMVNQSAKMLRELTLEEWEKIRYAFKENDLHVIRRDRGKQDVIELKQRLEQALVS